jgi:TDG/mug DNA glycosylase family protein
MSSPTSGAPTGKDLLAAAGRTRTVPDVIAPGLRVLFCGINPGLYSGATGHSFAHPGNRFWSTLHAADITPTRLRPDQERTLLEFGYGLTKFVQRATATAAELADDEFIAGARTVERKVRRYKPLVLAVLGLGAYRTAFGRPGAVIGLQAERIGATHIWLLPNPSGLNAHHKPADFVRMFRELHEYAKNLTAFPRNLALR